jgi:phosphinothricin acetyltransferase
MTTTDLAVRDMVARDWPAVCAIYEEGIATGNATFQTVAPTWSAWDAGHLPDCRLVAVESERVVGWAALSRVSDRCVYAGVAEVSVYVATAVRGRGVGRRLLEELVRRSEARGLWTLQAGIFPENTGSMVVHERCGFHIVGRRERLGQMNGRWRDVLLLERRSPIVGADGGTASPVAPARAERE